MTSDRPPPDVGPPAVGSNGAATAGDPALVESRNAAESAVRQAASGQPVQAESKWRPKIWLAVYLLLLAALAWAYPLLGTGVFHLPSGYAAPLRRIAIVLLLVVLARAGGTFAEVTLAPRIEDAADRYNLVKVLNLLSWVVVVLVGITQLFDRWYTAAASLGLVSLVLGLALQAPITSFFAWIYILARQPYQVGDRIQIGDATGDVIQVGYLDTTLWEFGGPYLSTDHPSGRIIKFPNANVLSQPVYNYTWPLFPYRWDEVRFQVAYTSDLDFVAGTMQRVVEEELGEQLLNQARLHAPCSRRLPWTSSPSRSARPCSSASTTTLGWTPSCATSSIRARQGA